MYGVWSVNTKFRGCYVQGNISGCSRGAAQSCHFLLSATAASRCPPPTGLLPKYSPVSFGEHFGHAANSSLYSPMFIICLFVWWSFTRVYKAQNVGNIFYALFYSCLFIVSRACHVYRWSSGSANEVPPTGWVRALVFYCGFWISLVGGGQCAFPSSN